MELRSFDSLDMPLAWRRVRTWSRSPAMEVPDRLPHEVLDRLFGDDGPPVQRYHEPRRPEWVISSKKSGTFRPLIRARPLDLIVYQALVDQLAPTIENALAPRDQVGAYRQDLSGSDDPFVGSPSNDEFRHTVRETVLSCSGSYVLETDVSGYFLGIRIALLREALLDCSDRPDVVCDLIEFLEHWQDYAVRGLPQGIRPSSPLGNLYLASLDRLLGRSAVPFFRWMDDMWAICDTYAEARRVQDVIEQHLYQLGLTLNGEKTRILRAETSADRLRTAAERWEQRRDEALGELVEELETAEYLTSDQIPEPEEVDLAVTLSDLDRLVAALDDESLPPDFSTDMSLVFRQLEAIEDPSGLASIPRVLVRAPDLSAVAMRYAASLAKAEPKTVGGIFTEVLSKERFARDFEKLNVCHKALSLKRDPKSGLHEELARLALQDAHPLVRAKALLAWGHHSNPKDFATADRFLQGAEPQWRVYAIVSIQAKSEEERNRRYDLWTAEGDEASNIAAKLKQQIIKWTKL
jgi:hypothetical protein